MFLHSGVIKVLDYGFERRLHQLIENVNKSPDPDVIDKFAPSIGRGAKKGDIYRVGILVLSLVKGQCVVENPPIIPGNIPVELKDFIQQ